MTNEQINQYIRDNYPGKSDRELSIATGISSGAVEHRRRRMGLTGGHKPPPQPTPSIETLVKQDTSKKKEGIEKIATKEKYSYAVSEITRLQSELDATREIKSATDIFTIEPRYSSGTSEATAIVLASDWHVEEEVKAEKVNGLNKYNLDISKKRAIEFFQKIVRLLDKESQDVKIDNVIVGLLGDFISGNIHTELLENCLLRPIEAIIYAQELIESGILFLMEHTKQDYLFVCHVGNHSRITKKIHHSNEQGNALEYIMYHNLHSRFRNESRIKFSIAEGYHTFLDVYDYSLRFHHGHNVQYGGGVGGLSIPLNKAIHSWNITRMTNIDLLGHFHQYMPLKRAVVNGSMIGFNAFAVAIKAEFEPPQQAFFLIDRKRGKTVHIPILFDS